MILAANITYTSSQALSDLAQVGPIVAVSTALLVAIILDLVLPVHLRGPVAAAVATLGYLGGGAAAIALWLLGAGHYAYSGFATGDEFAVFFDVLFAVLGILTVAISRGYLRDRAFPEAEFQVLLLASVAGMMVLASATSLVTVFLGLELLSVALYILSGFARADTRSQESAAKYLLVGGFASAFVLYGMALVYGATASTQLSVLAQRVTDQSAGNPLVVAGVMLMAIGFAYKVSAAPFHMWTPDVYQGAPLPVTTFMSVGTKAAAFAMIIRVFSQGLPHLAFEWQALLAFVSATSMIVGNLMAIVQVSMKRLLAYSGVAHAGYILVGVIAGGSAGVGAVLFYLAAYLFMNFGAFAVLTVLSGPDGEHEHMSDLEGLSARHPVLAVLLTLFLLSLAGFPPTVGFIGKFFLFAAGVSAGYTWLVVLAVLMSVVSVYYYIRAVIHIWSPLPGPRPLWVGRTASLALVVTGALSLALGISPALLFLIGQAGAGPVLAAGR